MTVISDYLRTSSLSGIPRNSRRDLSVHLDLLHTLLCGSVQASFVDFFILLSFHY